MPVRFKALSRFTVLTSVCLLLIGQQACLAQAKPAAPATIAEARKVLDLGTLPLPKGAEEPNHRNLGGLSCNVAGTVKSVGEFYRKQLIERKWKEAAGGYSTDQTVSATFQRDGYTVSLTVYEAGKPGVVSVMLMNFGNIDLAKLPVPPGAKTLFAGPASLMLVTATPVEATVKACQKMLTDKGWQPYGTAGDSYTFKQNAIRLMATIAVAPGQGGKTVITYSSELMSVDLPAPAETIGLQYSDSVSQLFFDTAAKPAEVVEFYTKTLDKAGWKPTTKNLVKIDFKEFMFFRNPEKDMLTLEVTEVDGKTRILLKHQTAAVVAEIEKRAKEAAEKKKKEEEAK